MSDHTQPPPTRVVTDALCAPATVKVTDDIWVLMDATHEKTLCWMSLKECQNMADKLGAQRFRCQQVPSVYGMLSASRATPGGRD